MMRDINQHSAFHRHEWWPVRMDHGKEQQNLAGKSIPQISWAILGISPAPIPRLPQALDGVDGVSQSGAILILAQLANKLTNISGGEALRKPTRGVSWSVWATDEHVGRRTLLPTCSPSAWWRPNTKHHHSSPAFGGFPVPMMVIPMVCAGCPQLKRPGCRWWWSGWRPQRRRAELHGGNEYVTNKPLKICG